MKLNPRHQKFADEYIKIGITEQAALKAGYSKKYARSQSYKLLANVGIAKYIEERMEKLQSESILTQEQVLEGLTSIARRETSKGSYKSTETINGETTEIIKDFENVPSIEEQIRAYELLGKRYSLFTEKKDVNLNANVDIVLGAWEDD